MIHMEREK